ncbi:MAG: hypothetical protein ACYTGX_18100 [Planctomycetota bacterium]
MLKTLNESYKQSGGKAPPKKAGDEKKDGDAKKPGEGGSKEG